MSKAQWDKPHFLTRTGPHSDKGTRSGHVESPPASAIDPVYAELHQRAKEIREAVHLLEKGLRDDGRTKLEWRRIIKRKKQLESELSALRDSQFDVYLPCYEAEFLRIARLVLPDDLIKKWTAWL